MTNVKRFTIRCMEDEQHYGIEVENPEGSFVYFSDYSLLLERCDVLEETVKINRKIRAYAAFALTGDENADVQLAADKITARLERMQKALKTYANDAAWDWDGDGYKWTGMHGKYDYRVKPSLEAREALEEKP